MKKMKVFYFYIFLFLQIKMAEVNTWDTEFEFALEIVKKGGEIIKNAFLR